jgi:HAD superfamily hydrolase (TIGR01509 family)
MTSADIRAVIFDLGNTLWFSAHEPSRADLDRMQADLLRSWLARSGLTLDEPVDAICRDVWDAYESAWRIEVERGSLRDPSLPFLVRGAFAVRGIELAPDLAQAFHRESWVGVRRFGVELYPDTLDVLRELRGRGVLIGINSNRPCSTAMMMADLADMGIAPYVDAAVSSGETGYLKPHPSTFESVIAGLGVAPHEAVMVGDSVAADLRGAKAAGMRTVWKLNGRYGLDAAPEADHAIHDLCELLTLPWFARGAELAATESLTPHEDQNADRY